MTSNDVPDPGAPAGRRRALGRGPGAGAPRAETPPPSAAEPSAPVETEPEVTVPEQAPEREAAGPEPVRESQPGALASEPVLESVPEVVALESLPGREAAGPEPVRESQPGVVASESARESGPEAVALEPDSGREAVATEPVREPGALAPKSAPEPEGVVPEPAPETEALAPKSAPEPEGVALEPAPEPEALASESVPVPDAASRAAVPRPVPEALALEPVPVPDAVVPKLAPKPQVVAPEPAPEPQVVAPGAFAEPGAAVPEAQLGAESGSGDPGEPGDGVFKVRLANFEGPFDLLLQLISKHKMDVTEVALSKVTDEFMAHIRAMGPDWDLDQTTEFLVVAATLLDLKAARLLPSAEVEDEADLALLEARDLLFARLLQYRAYKQIADIFNRRLEEEARRYPRTVGLEPHHAELLPEVVISIGAEGFAKLAVKAMQPKPKPQVYVDHIHAPLVSVQEQAGIVIGRLKELGEASFRVLVEDTDDTLTVVARFLALLELYREKAVALDQETALGELIVRWTGGEGGETPMVTDEFDRPPEVPKDEAKEEKA